MLLMDAKPTMRDRIGGRWALSWQASVAGSIVIVVLYATRGSTFGYSGSTAIALWTAVALCGVAVKSLAQLVGNATILRDRHIQPLSPVVVVTFHFTIGVIFTVGTLVAEMLLIPMDEPRPLSSWLFRIVAIALCGLWWYLIASVVLDARDRFGAERRQLLRELVALQVVGIEEREVAEQLRTRVRSEMDGTITQTRLRVASSLSATPADISDLSDDLRQLASGPVRSLSHQLMTSGEERYPRSDALHVLRSVWGVQRFWSLPVVLFIGLAFYPDAKSTFGVAWGIAAAALLSLTFGAVMTIANRTIDRHPQRSRAIYAAALLVLLALGVLFISKYPFASLLATDAPIAAPTLANVIGTVILISVPVLATSYAAALRDHRAEVLRRLRADHDEALAVQWALAERLALASRELGSELHGSLQTRLMVTAGALDRAAAVGDPDALIEALTQVMNVLREPLGSAAEELAADVILADHAGLWHGLMDVEITIDPGVDLRDEAPAVGTVCQEALANAYRHGQATAVAIHVSSGPTITVVDNGRGVSDEPDPNGMGLRRLRGLGEVEFAPGPGATRLTIRLHALSSSR